ncbi:MAG TPA: septum site-determining protein MinD [Candidatus Pacearchaeota archaeon]|nr:septum site-determining protein MinD [Candidatus Pacearchaeota archaeon]
MSKIIVITSGKGGVGKTTTAINLAAAMNYFGGDVLVIDGNLSTPNVGIHLNAPEVPVNLNHVLRGKAEPFEAVYEHDSGMKIMPSSLSIKELKKTKMEKLKNFKKEFGKIAEHVIFDSAAGLGPEASSVLEIADELIIVTNPEMPAITDALKAVKLAEMLKKPVKGVIVTRVRKDDIELSPEVVKEMLEIPILGMIPEDDEVKKSISTKNAVLYTSPKSKASRAYKEIAAKLLNVPYDSNKDREKMIIRILQKLGLKS